jgi:hypothetical protein
MNSRDSLNPVAGVSSFPPVDKFLCIHHNPGAFLFVTPGPLHVAKQ